MRTTLTASDLGFRPPQSPGAMAARHFTRGSITVAPPNAGTKKIRATTRRLCAAWTGAASGERGAPKRSSRRFGASDETTGAGPHRRTFVRPMASPATGRCGAGSTPSRRRLNLPRLKVLGCGETRTAGGPHPGPIGGSEAHRWDSRLYSRAMLVAVPQKTSRNRKEPITIAGFVVG